MSMNCPFADLPVELLFHIFKNLNNIDILYSLSGVNQKFDMIIFCDRRLSEYIDLTMDSLNETSHSRTNFLHRFISTILPKICTQIECFRIPGHISEKIIENNSYINLHKLDLINVSYSLISRIFNEKSSFIQNYRAQIHELVLQIIPEFTRGLFSDQIVYIDRIFREFSSLKCLDITVIKDRFELSIFPSTICSSSTITQLNVNLHNIDDLLCFLDGRLSQLQSYNVRLYFVHDPSLMRTDMDRGKIQRQTIILLNKTTKLDELKHFSLFVKNTTSEFGSLIIPIVCRMNILEILQLSITVSQGNSLIDCIYLDKQIVKNIASLRRFEFDIVSRMCFNDIRRTFTEREYNVDGYINYYVQLRSKICQCHVYSIPFNMKYMQGIAHCFPGGLFSNVNVLYIQDSVAPFEPMFFVKISHAFPSIRRLTISNLNEQTKKEVKDLSIVKFPRLVEVKILYSHMDYVEQFLLDSKTSAPYLTELHVHFEHLVTVTDNFTREETRSICANLNVLHFGFQIDVLYSEEFYEKDVL